MYDLENNEVALEEIRGVREIWGNKNSNNDDYLACDNILTLIGFYNDTYGELAFHMLKENDTRRLYKMTGVAVYDGKILK